jgi:cysteine dioxygenase
MAAVAASRVLPLDEILSILKGVKPAQFEPPHVSGLLGGVSVEPGSLERFLHFLPGRYTRNLVFRNDDFEMLALCWDKQVFSPIHNHSGQECWFLVQEGQFCLEGYRLLEGGTCPGAARLEHTDSRHRVSLGALDHRGPLHDIHRVTVSRGNPRAVSIHIYAKPFDDCLVYDIKHERCSRQSLKYYSVDGRPVA